MKRAVVVTTAHRGVFFGDLVSEDDDKKIVVIENARNCLYWPSSVNGFSGLATVGPLGGSRIGPSVPTMKLHDVTAVLVTTDEAEALWRK